MPLYEQFNNLWSNQQIYIVAALLKEADVASNDEDEDLLQSILGSIDQLLQAKENASVKIINTFTLNLTKL
jgi:hypothetical protein